MKRRTKTIVIIVLVLGVLAMAGPSLVWYLRNGNPVDPGAQGEAQKQETEQQRQ